MYIERHIWKNVCKISQERSCGELWKIFKVVESCGRFLKLWKVVVKSSLYLIPQLKTLFVEARLDFSLLGIGVHIDNASLMASTEEDAINMMLQALTKHHKKLLITIDEVTYNNDIAKFSHAMSSYATAGYDAYVLMTGLKENINSLKISLRLLFYIEPRWKSLIDLI